MGIKTREAIVGLVVYRLMKFMVRRSLAKKGGGIMAGKKVGLMAMIAAAVGALFFWRKKKKGHEVV